MITVSTMAAAITTHAPVSHGPDSGRMNKPIATPCTRVFSLPPRLAGMTPRRSTANRRTVTPISRTMMTTVTHHGRSPSIDSPISAAPMSALSAMGSASVPNSVTIP